jgi:hypothetical protein
MWSKVKDYLYEKRYYILGGLSLIGALYLYKTYNDNTTPIITSSFIQNAKDNVITKAIVDGDIVTFKIGESWFRASVDGIPK